MSQVVGFLCRVPVFLRSGLRTSIPSGDQSTGAEKTNPQGTITAFDSPHLLAEYVVRMETPRLQNPQGQSGNDAQVRGLHTLETETDRLSVISAALPRHPMIPKSVRIVGSAPIQHRFSNDVRTEILGL